MDLNITMTMTIGILFSVWSVGLFYGGLRLGIKLSQKLSLGETMYAEGTEPTIFQSHTDGTIEEE